ncbi:MAG TPA: DUF4424 family protein, partial [bacterium]|nr:DUF4424 family protein [bacterium]
MRFPFLMAFTLCLTPAAAWANDGSATLVGDAYAFTPNDQIELLQEDLRIALDDGISTVEVQFRFHNTGGATEVTMAFPDEGMGDSGGRTSIEGFQSEVDGHPVAVEYRHLIPTEDPDAHEGVWVKTIPFAADQTRTVSVSYKVRNGGSVFGDSTVQYILVTGATWKGKIWDFSCTVDWSALNTYSAPEIVWWQPKAYEPAEGPSGWTITGPRERVLKLKEFEPTANLALHMAGGFWHFTVDGKPVPVKQGFHHTDFLRPFVDKHGEVWMSIPKVGQLLGVWSDDPDDWPPIRPWRHPRVAGFGGEPAVKNGDELHFPDGTVKIMGIEEALAAPYEGATHDEYEPVLALR